MLGFLAVSAAAAPYRPTAGALTPEVVGERDLAAANAVFAGLENLVVVLPISAQIHRSPEACRPQLRVRSNLDPI